jgi:hypothetical protein
MNSEAVNLFNLILALWARSLLWQLQQHQSSLPAAPQIEVLHSAKRLFLLARPSDEDVVFMCAMLIDVTMPVT